MLMTVMTKMMRMVMTGDSPSSTQRAGMFLALYLVHRADVLLDKNHVGERLPTLPAWKLPSLAEQQKENPKSVALVQ